MKGLCCEGRLLESAVILKLPQNYKIHIHFLNYKTNNKKNLTCIDLLLY